jgi:hypothetical protein
MTLYGHIPLRKLIFQTPDPKLIKIGGPCKNLEKQTMAIKRNWLENPKKYIEYIYIHMTK